MRPDEDDLVHRILVVEADEADPLLAVGVAVEELQHLRHRPELAEVLLEVVIRHAVVQSSRPALECEAAGISNEDLFTGKVVRNFILHETGSLEI